MPGNKAGQQKESSAGAKYALIGTIITAVIGLLGTALTLGVKYFEGERDRHDTQTAEERTRSSPATATPTYTLTPTHAPTLTFTPTASPTSTPTSTPEVNGLQFCVTAGSVNVRTGPGIDYQVISTITFPACLYFDGRNEDGSWLRVSMNQEAYLLLGKGWVNASYLTRPDNQLPPVIEIPPLPYPTITPAG